MINTSDGGYLIGGWTSWYYMNSSYAWNTDNFFLLKTDRNGNQEWYHIYGDNQSFMGGYVCEALEGGYVLGGANGMYGTGLVCLIKVDARGQVLWERDYWPGFEGRVKSLDVTPDGYIMAGTSNHSMFLMKFSRDGNLTWNRTYDEPRLDPAGVLPAKNGGYIVAGGPDFDSTGKMFLMKIDANGNLSWKKSYGSVYTGGLSVIEDRAGGYVIAGHNSTANVMPWNQYDGSEVYVVRTDQAGDILWEKTYDLSSDNDFANSIVQMDDGGYAVTGTAIRARSGWRYVADSDAFILRLDGTGVQQWVRSYGSPGEARGIAIVKSDDGEIVMAGERGNSEILLVKSPDTQDSMATIKDAIRPVESVLYHNPSILYCIAPVFLVWFIAMSIGLIALKRWLDKMKKTP